MKSPSMRTLLASPLLLLAACASAPQPAPDGTAPMSTTSSKSPTASAPEADFRAKPPAPGPDVVFRAPVPKVLTLKSGLAVWLLERQDLPLVSMVLVVDAGSNTNPKGMPGVSSFVAAMLDEGTSSRDALATAAAFEDLAAVFRADSDAETLTASLSVPTASLGKALEVYADVILHPAFKPADVERTRKLRLGELQQQMDDASQVGRAVLARVIYGDKNPWGFPAKGTLESTKKVSRATLSAWHKTWVRPNNATLVVVGDVHEADLVPLLEARFGKWAKAKLPSAKLPPAASLKVRPLVLVDKAGAAQSQVWIGQLAVSSSSPDLYATRLANIALGSGKGRLTANLRTKHAYSYGAYSFLVERRQEGAFAAFGGIVADKTPEAVQEFLNELTGMASGGVTDTELSEARSAAIQGLPARFESNDATAAAFASAQSLGFGTDYFANLPDKLTAVSKADADQAAKAHFAPEHMPIIVVGPMKSLEERLVALNVGPVQKRDAAGKLLPAPKKAKAGGKAKPKPKA
jgi:zinc protease